MCSWNCRWCDISTFSKQNRHLSQSLLMTSHWLMYLTRIGFVFFHLPFIVHWNDGITVLIYKWAQMSSLVSDWHSDWFLLKHMPFSQTEFTYINNYDGFFSYWNFNHYMPTANWCSVMGIYERDEKKGSTNMWCIFSLNLIQI